MNGAEFLRLGDERSFLVAVFIRLTLTIGLAEREFTSTLRFYVDSLRYCLRNDIPSRAIGQQLIRVRVIVGRFG